MEHVVADEHPAYILSIVVPQFVQPIFRFIQSVWLYGTIVYGYVASTLSQLRDMAILAVLSSSSTATTGDSDSDNNCSIDGDQFLNSNNKNNNTVLTTTDTTNSISRYIFPIVVILLIFWPLLLSLVMAFLYSSAWFFWITTSILIGTIQVLYATYQFLMISLDLLGLSVLKTYSMIRHSVLYYVDIVATTTTTTSNASVNRRIISLRKSRRRLWREMLDKAGTYENFLKLRIEGKDTNILLRSSSFRNNTISGIATKYLTSADPINHNDSNVSSTYRTTMSTTGSSSNSNLTMDAALPLASPTSPIGESPTNSGSSNNRDGIRRAHSFTTSTTSPSSYLKRPLKSTPTSLRLHDNDLVVDDGDLLLYESTSNTNNNNDDIDSCTIRPRRNLSFTCGDKSPYDKLRNNNDSNAETTTELDPIIVLELGSKVSDLLVSTIARLKEARMQAMEQHPLHSSVSFQPQLQDDEDDEDDENVSDSTDVVDHDVYHSTTNNNNNNDQHRRHSLNIRRASRNNNNTAAMTTLKYLLSAVVKRNHLSLDDILIENARSVADCGQYGLSNQSRQLIRSYYEEVQKALDYVCDSPIFITAPSTSSMNQQQQQQNQFNNSYSSLNNNNNNNNNSNNSNSNYIRSQQQNELNDRITLIRKMKQNIGRTALMFSGGGAQAMYHLGVIRALIESKLYNDITVISGTSGGSITAAMCAIKTSEELYNDVCVPTVSTDYGKNGKQKELNIRWFPTMFEMISYWMKHRLVVDSTEFGRTCEFYYGTITFEEAFVRTGKHVCITVSASRDHSSNSNSSSGQRLLLNHISTPNVTIASAVRASCALPGVMAPAKLMVKNNYTNVLEPFEVDGVEWIDGSVQADLPFERISTLFAVTSFIVSQTNFHIVPFINKNHHPNQNSLYWSLFQTMEWDIRNRALKLSRLGLFPHIFGQDISKVFKQKYHGNLTIVPRFTTMQTFGLKILSNPTVKDMEGYLKYSQIATWPYLNVIRDMTRLEKSLDDCLARLEARMRSLLPSSADQSTEWSTTLYSFQQQQQLYYNDDIESIASMSAAPSATMISSTTNTTTRNVRIAAEGTMATTSSNSNHTFLQERINGLEQENENLRKELEQLRKQVTVAVDDSCNTTNNTNNSSNKNNDSPCQTAVVSNTTESNAIADQYIQRELVDHDDDEETTNEDDDCIDDDDGTKTPSLADGAEGFVWKHVVSTTTVSSTIATHQSTTTS